jgi:Fur family peroxide stress response transcriptional regulator
MEISISQIKDRLVEKGLKVTPQRIAILEAIYILNNHPTAEMIMDYIKDTHPGISSATVYKVLDALLENQLIRRVKTEKGIKRYDGIMENHHHLYCSESEEMEDYMNENLDQLLADYFKKNGIKNFEIRDIKLQINGTFLKSKKDE